MVASDFTKTHSEILLVLLFVNLIAIFQTLLNETMKLSILDSENTNAALRRVANIIVLISSVWMLYKLLGFALVHYGYLQLFFLYINLLAAILLVNVVLFFVMLPLFRMILPAPRAVEGN